MLINNYIQTVLNELSSGTSNKVWGHLELTIATGFTKKEKEEMKQEEISSDSGDLETIPVSFSFPLHLDDIVESIADMRKDRDHGNHIKIRWLEPYSAERSQRREFSTYLSGSVDYCIVISSEGSGEWPHYSEIDMILMCRISGTQGPPKSFENSRSLAEHMHQRNSSHNWSSDVLIIEAKKVYRGRGGEKGAGKNLITHLYQVIGECLALK